MVPAGRSGPDAGPRPSVKLLTVCAEDAGPGPGAPWGSEGCEQKVGARSSSGNMLAVQALCSAQLES